MGGRRGNWEKEKERRDERRKRREKKKWREERRMKGSRVGRRREGIGRRAAKG